MSERRGRGANSLAVRWLALVVISPGVKRERAPVLVAMSERSGLVWILLRQCSQLGGDGVCVCVEV